MSEFFQAEPRYYGVPLGVWVELWLSGFIGFSIYLAAISAKEFFPHLQLLRVEGLIKEDTRCPRGYAATVSVMEVVCKTKLGIALDAARSMNRLLLVTGGIGLMYVLVRKARDAGVTFALPWSPKPTRGPPGRNTNSGPGAEGPGMPPGNQPVVETPEHAWFAWWIEPVLIAHTCTSLLVFLTLLLRLVTHRGRLPRHDSLCDSGAWTPKWVWQFNNRDFMCADGPAILLTCALELFNALVAAGLNGLAVVLTRQRRTEEGGRW